MAIFSSLRSRRFNTRKAENIQSFVTFQLRTQWFALAINSARKVVTLEQVDSTPNPTGMSLIRYQNQEILVIDVGHKIFGASPTNILINTSLKESCLLIFQNSQGDFLGLPIDSSPVIQRVPESSIIEIPKTYKTIGNINDISSQMIDRGSDSPIFLLETEKLIEGGRS